MLYNLVFIPERRVKAIQDDITTQIVFSSEVEQFSWRAVLRAGRYLKKTYLKRKSYMLERERQNILRERDRDIEY